MQASLDANWQLATVKSLAGFLGVAEKKVIHWIDSNELTAANVGTVRGKRPVYRIRREDFDRFWAARSSAAPVKQSKRRPRPNTKSFV